VLSGKQATIADGALADIQKKYPDVRFLQNGRWAQCDPVVFTSAATGAGIDLALDIVDLYYGHDVAHHAARIHELFGAWLGG
jgi:transcriptional regulator GlxA family with amidase domain